MNYAQFTMAIQDYTSNNETSFVSHIPEFLQMAEKRIYQEAQLPVEQQAYTYSIATNQSTLSTASMSGYIAVDSVAVVVSGSYQYLDNKDEEYLRAAFPNPSTQGVPRLYNVYDNNTIKFAPPADTAYSVEVRYFSYPASIVTAGTSWLGDTFEFALLYGALREAAVYLKEEVDVIAMYENRYRESLEELKRFANTRARLDAYRTRKEANNG